VADCILVVDDDPAIRMFVSAALKEEGYAVQTATNGAEALEIIGKQPTCLVLLDMKMPVMDGWEFLKRYCEQGQTVPIIAFSAHVKGTGPLGCTREFLAKPFDLNTLLNLVGKYVAPAS
jgi:CheY-like chemotaxis protein